MDPKPLYKSKRSSLNNEQFQNNLDPKKEQMNNERRIVISNFVSGNFQELDEKVKSMMDWSQNRIQCGDGERRAKICKVCGKEGQSMAIRDHIEANHLEGVSLPCNVCEKTFRSRMILRKHKRITQI